ncbi:hypothetical protein RhiirA4_453962 [Rhizophagus irregularis]|uniref:Uncharacterized protein n=1 Tax=Rhizophagus irregularis TaxID=588596 RepID=A0A2I1G1R3_9GLOM|nr:hypothetical protein RhiirA4_453962 [Rhizophagus irregularis]
MSQSQFPRSLFFQFTEDELKKISESYKSSVNWTEYNKWLKAGQPFEEHEEIELFTNGSSQRQVSAGTEICNVDRRQEQSIGVRSRRSEGKANHKAGKKCYFTTPSIRFKAEVVTCNDHEHHDEVPKSKKVSSAIKYTRRLK